MLFLGYLLGMIILKEIHNVAVQVGVDTDSRGGAGIGKYLVCLNLVLAGYMNSNPTGMNLLLDKYRARGVPIVPCSDFIRASYTT